MLKITHITSAHSRYDIRIFLKMCKSLAEPEEYAVNLIVADGNGDEVCENVVIYDIGKMEGRANRFLNAAKNIYPKAVDLDSDIYHLHDPELIPLGLKMKKIGKTVIFDAHEDLPKQLLTKPYLNKFLLLMLSKVATLYERYSGKKYDAIITATPSIKYKFLKINKNSIEINNFPILEEFNNDTTWGNKKDEVCYIGGIAEIRGIKELIKTLELLSGVSLNLAGDFAEKHIEQEVKTYSGWQKVNELGFIDRKKAKSVLAKSKAGIVTFHPSPNHVDAQPNKMFEYMSAGIPVIASHFPLWTEIVEGNNCGICVNPLSPKEMADAIEYIISHPEEAEKMGQNGKNAVIKKYNWDVEKLKLFKVYEQFV